MDSNKYAAMRNNDVTSMVIIEAVAWIIFGSAALIGLINFLRQNMGLIRRMIYANLVPKRIRDAAKIDELKKQNALLKALSKKK